MPKLWADNIDDHRTLVRRRLVDAFLELLGEGPLDQVTMSAVAERADLARSAVYNHVDHVHDLALLHAEQLIGDWLAPLQADAEAGRDMPAFDRLEHLVRTSFEVFATDQLGGMDLSGHLDPQRSARLFGLLMPIMQHLRDIVVDGVESGEFVAEDTAALTQYVWASIGGHRAMLGGGRADPAAAADMVVRMLRRALLADPAGFLDHHDAGHAGHTGGGVVSEVS